MYLIYGLSTIKCIVSFLVNLFILRFVFLIRPYIYCKHYSGGIVRFSDSSSLNIFYLKLLISQSKFSGTKKGTRKFTLTYQ